MWSKTFIGLACVLTLLAHTAQCQQAQQQQSSCLAQNPLIGVLKTHKVKVYAQPQTSKTETCASEWKEHKTCCKSHHLLKYAKTDMIIIGETLSKVKKTANKLLTFIKQNDKVLSKALKNASALNQTDFVTELSNELNAFRKSLTFVFHNESAAHAFQKQCFERILEIKTNSLCFTCSGRSAHFFLKGLALMGTDDCRKTVHTCLDYWHRTGQLVDAMESAQKFHSKLSSIIPGQEVSAIDSDSIQQLQNWVGSPQARATVKHCAESPDSCSESSQKLLCEAFIWLRPKYFGKKDVKPEPSESTAQTSNAEMADEPKVSHSAAVWALGKSRLLTAEKKKHSESPIGLDFRQDIQVVRCKQTETGSVPMTFSGRLLTGADESHPLAAENVSSAELP